MKAKEQLSFVQPWPQPISFARRGGASDFCHDRKAAQCIRRRRQPAVLRDRAKPKSEGVNLT
jgi:hypothetical protein